MERASVLLCPAVAGSGVDRALGRLVAASASVTLVSCEDVRGAIALEILASASATRWWLWSIILASVVLSLMNG